MRRRVTEELAQCYLSQGVCLARSPRMLESDDLQRQSHQLLAKALSLYKDAGNRKQAAACHYQLGHSFFLIVQRAASGAYVSPERLRMALNSATSHFDQAMNGYRGAGEELELCDTLLVIVKDYTAVFALIAKLNGGNIAGRIGGTCVCVAAFCCVYLHAHERTPAVQRWMERFVLSAWWHACSGRSQHSLLLIWWAPIKT